MHLSPHVLAEVHSYDLDYVIGWLRIEKRHVISA